MSGRQFMKEMSVISLLTWREREREREREKEREECNFLVQVERER